MIHHIFKFWIPNTFINVQKKKEIPAEFLCAMLVEQNII